LQTTLLLFFLVPFFYSRFSSHPLSLLPPFFFSGVGSSGWRNFRLTVLLAPVPCGNLFFLRPPTCQAFFYLSHNLRLLPVFSLLCFFQAATWRALLVDGLFLSLGLEHVAKRIPSHPSSLPRCNILPHLRWHCTFLFDSMVLIRSPVLRKLSSRIWVLSVSSGPHEAHSPTSPASPTFPLSYSTPGPFSTLG